MFQVFVFRNLLRGPFGNQIHRCQPHGDFHLARPPTSQCKCSYMGSSLWCMEFYNLADEYSHESFVCESPWIHSINHSMRLCFLNWTRLFKQRKSTWISFRESCSAYRHQDLWNWRRSPKSSSRKCHRFYLDQVWPFTWLLQSITQTYLTSHHPILFHPKDFECLKAGDFCISSPKLWHKHVVSPSFHGTSLYLTKYWRSLGSSLCHNSLISKTVRHFQFIFELPYPQQDQMIWLGKRSNRWGPRLFSHRSKHNSFHGFLHRLSQGGVPKFHFHLL